MLAFFAFIVAMFISMMLIPPLMRSAQKLAFIDLPSARKVHDAPIPRIGGLAMVAGAVTPMLLWVEPARHVTGFLWGVAVIIAFGMWDDRKPLDYRIKFFGQFIAVLLVVFYGGVRIRYVPFAGFEPIGDIPSIALTVFALLGITNAINLSDGLDGLAGGTTLLTIGTLSLLAFLVKDGELLILSMAVMGSIIGFLRFNTHPAQIFMGDAGSQFLGFSCGVLVIVLTQQSSTVLSPSMPLLLLGLPLIDTFIVMGQRLFEGRSPFKPDRNHIHHKLLDLGFDHYESVVVIYTLQASLVSLAFAFRYQSDHLNVGLFTAVLVTLAAGLTLAGRHGWRVRTQPDGERVSAVSQLARDLKRHRVLSRAPAVFAALSMLLFGAWAVAGLNGIPADGKTTVLALTAVAVAVFGWRARTPQFALVERLIIYIAITTIVFYWCAGRAVPTGLVSIENAYFLLLGVSVLVAYRFGHNRSFDVTPTDFLIILIALLVPTVTRTLFPQHYIGEVAIKTLVLFYAVELILAQAGRRLWLVRTATAGVLAFFVLRLVSDSITIRAAVGAGTGG